MPGCFEDNCCKNESSGSTGVSCRTLQVAGAIAAGFECKFGETKGRECNEKCLDFVRKVKVEDFGQMGFALMDMLVACSSWSFRIGKLNRGLSFLHVFLKFQELELLLIVSQHLLRLVGYCFPV